MRRKKTLNVVPASQQIQPNSNLVAISKVELAEIKLQQYQIITRLDTLIKLREYDLMRYDVVFYSTNDIVEELGVSKETVKRWFQSGKLVDFGLGGPHRTNLTHLIAFLKGCKPDHHAKLMKKLSEG